MVLDILELVIENKHKIYIKNCLKIMVLEIHKNDLFCPYNPPKNRNAFMFVIFVIFFVDTSAFFFDISETHFQDSFL